MANTTPKQNKALVLEAFDTLFNRRDYEAAASFWSDRYIQHSAHIEPGREGLFNLIRSAPDTLRYEHQLIVAEDDYVIVHGRFSGTGRPVSWIAADIVRIGTSCRTRRHGPSRRAGFRCSGIDSLLEENYDEPYSHQCTCGCVSEGQLSHPIVFTPNRVSVPPLRDRHQDIPALV
jgi:predicted SnoaL-like aldol condensation-catalyzing enzyme